MIHDYGCNHFSIQLGRELACRGYRVSYSYCASIKGAKSQLEKRPEDPDSLDVVGLDIGREIPKYSFIRRKLGERAFGKLLAATIREVQPDVVICANAPLDSMSFAIRESRALGVRFVYWLQDLRGLAAYTILKKKIPILGWAVGLYYLRFEKMLLKKSDAIVLITEDFRGYISKCHIRHDRVYVIENWAVLDELVPKSRRKRMGGSPRTLRQVRFSLCRFNRPET